MAPFPHSDPPPDVPSGTATPPSAEHGYGPTFYHSDEIPVKIYLLNLTTRV